MKQFVHSTLLAGAALSLAAPLSAADSAAKSTPFTLDEALGAPDWMDLHFENTTRYETLENQFRPGYAGSDQILLSRSLASFGAKSGSYSFKTEFIDCRQSMADSGTRLTSSIVDTVDLLQLYVQASYKEALLDGDLTFKAGRQTVDLGSRRFVARQAYRLTINAFDGADVEWKKGRTDLHLFYYMPVNIRPTAAAALLDNDNKLNESTSGTKFFGAFLSLGDMPAKGTLELYTFFLDEKDGRYATADQNLCTPGFRYFRKAAKNTFDYEVEAAYQFGTSYSSTGKTDTKELDNSAWMTHLAFGYTFDAPWSPRVSLEYNYASGDDNATDDKNQHYNSLYGVARADLGPTSLYGAMSRTNINTPGIRLTVKPAKGWDFMLCERMVWLASDTDSWAGVRDKTGATDDYVGNQIEGRLRWEALPKNLKFEVGFAYLMEGGFMKDAPNSPDNGDVFYSYVSMTISL